MVFDIVDVVYIIDIVELVDVIVMFFLAIKLWNMFYLLFKHFDPFIKFPSLYVPSIWAKAARPCHSKNKNYFTLDNLSKYGHITLKFVSRYFIWFVTIFSKK